MRQRLHHDIQIIRLVEIIKPHKSRQIPPPKQIPSQLPLPIQLAHQILAKNRPQRQRNVLQAGLVFDPIILRQTPITPPLQMQPHEMAALHAVNVGRRLFAPSAKELAADETAVNVRGGFEGRAAEGREVEIEGAAIDAVKVGAGGWRWCVAAGVVGLDVRHGER